ncbi:MAG: polyprenyl synthetase family protein [Candidatus Altiarchaeota archaeon]
MDVYEILNEKSQLVEPLLLEYTRQGNPKMQEMLAHPIMAGGKRIRPCLLLLACEAVGGNPNKVLKAAASVELLHTFTLIHDDIMDHDSERRGRPTVHSLWGEEMAIIVGDTMYSGAFKALVEVRNDGINPELVLNAVDALVEANSKLQEGQILDMMFEERDVVSEEEYLDMVMKKTGSLIEASVRIGSILGGGSGEESSCLSTFGRNTGTAFQIKDDLLDITADQRELGKPVGSDIRKGKKTLIMVHALNNSNPAQRDILLRTLGNEDASDDDVSEVLCVMNETGSIKFAEDKVVQLTEEGRVALGKLDDSDARNSLLKISEYLVERRN